MQKNNIKDALLPMFNERPLPSFYLDQGAFSSKM